MPAATPEEVTLLEPAALAVELRAAEFDFLDLGAGRGDSLLVYERLSGRRGVGLELDRRKVADARAAGRSVLCGDITSLPAGLGARFATADNVLEHLRSLGEIEAVLAACVRSVTDYVYVRHPAFDDEDRLRELGVFRYWTDWRGHRCPATLPQLLACAERVGITDWEIHPVHRIVDSSDPRVLPLGAGTDQHRYDPARHGPKPSVDFEFPVYEAYDVVFHLRRPRGARLGRRRLAARGIPRPAVVLDDDPTGVHAWVADAVAVLRGEVRWGRRSRARLPAGA